MAAAPPPPPPPANMPPPPVAQKPQWKRFEGPNEVFVFAMNETAGEYCVDFKNSKIGKGGTFNPPVLAVAVQTITGIRSHKDPIPLNRLRQGLGRMRGLLLDIETAKQDVSQADEFQVFAKARALEQLYGLGWTPPKVEIEGLEELVAAIEEVDADGLQAARAAVRADQITFFQLAELYRPGTMVSRRVDGLLGETLAMRVRSCWFTSGKTLFGVAHNFHISLEFVGSVGPDFVICTFDDQISDWTGPRRAQDLDYVPFTEDNSLYGALVKRGSMYAEVGVGPNFMECPGNSFIPRRTRNFKGSTYSGKAGGTARIMIDNTRGLAEGAFGMPDSDPHTYALLAAVKLHKQLMQHREREEQSDGSTSRDVGGGKGTVGIFRKLPKSLYWCSWPTLLGFNFAAKCWGHVVVETLKPARFQDDLLNRLVLAEDAKMLVRAFVAQQGNSTFNDILAGKRGASVVLLHGPPGVGKTLTAEAMAESFHKPLYPVSMGELGESSKEVEERLGEVLELCTTWDCIVLIDEADTILEKREAFDIAKNAIVSVMLRLLEYHDGVVFLTTNRIAKFDPAVISRVTISIAYSDLVPVERERVWKLLLGSSGVDESSIDVGKLAKDYTMNGREIKNTLRLAIALAADQKTPLSQSLLEKVVSAVLKGARAGAGTEEYTH